MSLLEEHANKILSEIAIHTCTACVHTAYFYNLVFHENKNRLTKNVTEVPTV
jgi:putative effector of murein hydrolase LrgA (UPF0299 family)